jgi:hypothetical protein
MKHLHWVHQVAEGDGQRTLPLCDDGRRNEVMKLTVPKVWRAFKLINLGVGAEFSALEINEHA